MSQRQGKKIRIKIHTESLLPRRSVRIRIRQNSIDSAGSGSVSTDHMEWSPPPPRFGMSAASLDRDPLSLSGGPEPYSGTQTRALDSPTSAGSIHDRGDGASSFVPYIQMIRLSYEHNITPRCNLAALVGLPTTEFNTKVTNSVQASARGMDPPMFESSNPGFQPTIYIDTVRDPEGADATIFLTSTRVAASPKAHNTLVVAFKGTVEFTDMLKDINVAMVPYPYLDRAGPLVYGGPFVAYNSARRSLLDLVQEVVDSNPDVVSLVVCGHSFGGVLATLMFPDLCRGFANMAQISLVTIGSPRCGNEDFCEQVEALCHQRPRSIHRLVVERDFATHFPPRIMNAWGQYTHVSEPIFIDAMNAGMVLRQLSKFGEIDAESGSRDVADSTMNLVTSGFHHLRYGGIDFTTIPFFSTLRLWWFGSVGSMQSALMKRAAASK
jgi:hypothetical protein